MKMAATSDVTVMREVDIVHDPVFAAYRDHLARYDIKRAAEEIWKIISALDKRIQETEPFRLAKTEPEKAKELIAGLVHEVWNIAAMLHPFLPETSDKILNILRNPKEPIKPLFARLT
jgi:methionyl-tRNA synthetase